MILRLIVCMMLIGLSQGADAQLVTRNPDSTGAVSFEDITARHEKILERIASPPRSAQFDFAWPDNAEEYAKVDKQVIVLVSSVVRDPSELPLQRVYFSTGSDEKALVLIGAMQTPIDQDSKLGAAGLQARQDAFYLAPAEWMMKGGFLLADFATNRAQFKLYELPVTNPPDFFKADKYPTPQGKIDSEALWAFLRREYTGFEPLDRP